eukprot:6213020-Pleurochrysis_carterae.AAC.2
MALANALLERSSRRTSRAESRGVGATSNASSVKVAFCPTALFSSVSSFFRAHFAARSAAASCASLSAAETRVLFAGIPSMKGCSPSSSDSLITWIH